MTHKQKLLYVVNEVDFFLSHRLPVARAAEKAGYEVHVAAPEKSDAKQRIGQLGFSFHPVSLTRKGIHPLQELNGFLKLLGLYKRLRPDMVHHVTIKPVLYGGIAARMARIPAMVSAIPGLGYVFNAQGLKASFLRGAVKLLYRLAVGHPNSRVIFQNPDDANKFLEEGIVNPGQVILIRGSGVDTDEFAPTPEPQGIPVVLLASRMLWDKGVGEFVAAARLLKGEGVEARFVLVGDADEGNPTAIAPATLRDWHGEGCIEWWGHKNHMAHVHAASNIACLPSYSEGVPKVLIEAASCGRAIVTTDVPGCREIVHDGENGLLVPPMNVAALAGALRKLIENPSLRRQMGVRGRELVVAGFSVGKVVAETLEVYEELTGKAAEP